MKHVIFGFIGLCLIFALVGEDFDNEVNNYKSKVGNKVILNNDTLMIIDYSFMNGNFTLENGTRIDYSLVEKLSFANKPELIK